MAKCILLLDMMKLYAVVKVNTKSKPSLYCMQTYIGISSINRDLCVYEIAIKL